MPSDAKALVGVLHLLSKQMKVTYNIVLQILQDKVEREEDLESLFEDLDFVLKKRRVSPAGNRRWPNGWSFPRIERKSRWVFNNAKCRWENGEMPRLCAGAVIAESKDVARRKTHVQQSIDTTGRFQDG
jgi:hypothetical protein